VISLGTSTGIPGQGVTSNGYIPQGLKDPIMINVIDVDDDYLDVMNIPVIMGEGFSRESGMDSFNILINESLVKRLAWDDPIGKTIHRDTNMKVIGVVEDFHFAPLNEDIEPLLMTQVPWNGFYHLSVRTSEGKGHETMMRIKDEWNVLFPDESFEYFSLEEYISEAYTDVSGLRSIFIYFAILAIIVACLGLLGLTFYSTGQKAREVGIRKVFGAENNEITFKLVREFLKWVLMANIIAFPFAAWAMNNWLQNFAYRVNTSFMVMLYTLLITFGLSILTIIFQAMRLAGTNPADILKDE
jgi:putative ABC transport system permease protein